MNDPLLPDEELEEDDDDEEELVFHHHDEPEELEELEELELVDHHHCASHVDAAMPVKNRQAIAMTIKFRTVFFIINPFHKHIFNKPFPTSHSFRGRVEALKAFALSAFLFSQKQLAHRCPNSPSALKSSKINIMRITVKPSFPHAPVVIRSI